MTQKSTRETIEIDNRFADDDHRRTKLQNKNSAIFLQMYPADVTNPIYTLKRNRVTVGRESDSTIQLEHESVSRFHAVVRKQDGHFTICDAGSTNGTSVNRIGITKAHILKPGDIVRIGVYTFKFLPAESLEARFYDELRGALIRDSLTHTFTKSHFARELSTAARLAWDRKTKLSLVMMDVDHFKLVNDTYGHIIGDSILCGIGKRLLNHCDGNTFVGRFGGEEFCILIREATHLSVVEATERIRRVIANEPFPTDSGSISITASFGVASCDMRSHSTCILGEDLLGTADRQLLLAKRHGRDRVCATEMKPMTCFKNKAMPQVNQHN